ncbi:hypothetical protein GQ457_08G032730 [Hibiscus cannabinus]
MENKINVVSTLSKIMLLFLSAVEVQSGALDVVAKFGAKADEKTDLSKVTLSDAWKEACASATTSSIVIPKGVYFLSQATLEGPCKAPIELQVQGTIKARTDPKAFKEPKWIEFNKVENFKMSGGGVFDGQGTRAYKREGCDKKDFCSALPINIRFDYLTNAMIQDITTRDSKQFHVNILGCKNITLQKFSVRAPKDSPNTDGIHIGRSDGVNIIDSDIRTGDDCISIGDSTKHLDIKGVTCGPGHGISIGSLGKFENEEPVEGITASKCTLSDTTNGVRIKTWAGEYGGTVSDVHFEDITVKNAESNVKLSNISFKNIRGTAALPEVVKIICSGKFPCENVELAAIDIKYSGPKGPGVSECKNVKPKFTGKQNPPACAAPVPLNPTPTV